MTRLWPLLLLPWFRRKVVDLGPMSGRPVAEARTFAARNWQPDFEALHEACPAPPHLPPRMLR